MSVHSRDIGCRVVYVDILDGEKEYAELVAFVGKHECLIKFDSGRYGIVSEYEVSKL